MNDPTSADGRTVLVAGATGLVGRELVGILAADPAVSRIALPVRRSLPPGFFPGAPPAKLRPVLVDFAHLDAHREIFQVAQVFICLGTTIKIAGSQEAFRKVDYDHVMAAARAGAQGGARDLLVITALGSSASSPVFYSRVKGEVEASAAKLPYRSVTFFRPSLLVGERGVPRPGERVGAAIGSVIGPLMLGPLARYRPVAAKDVAKAMAVVARAPEPGVRVLESEEIVRLARAG
jgi:uncharacterized protein YbjT (DUF2867 family)